MPGPVVVAADAIRAWSVNRPPSGTVTSIGLSTGASDAARAVDGATTVLPDAARPASTSAAVTRVRRPRSGRSPALDSWGEREQSLVREQQYRSEDEHRGTGETRSERPAVKVFR